MNHVSWSSAATPGVIGLLIGLVITYVVSLINPATNLGWSLSAVGFASLCAAFAGYIVEARKKIAAK